MNAHEKHVVRNRIAWRRDIVRRFGSTLQHEWRMEIARHCLVPESSRSAADRFLIRFAQRQLRTAR